MTRDPSQGEEEEMRISLLFILYLVMEYAPYSLSSVSQLGRCVLYCEEERSSTPPNPPLLLTMQYGSYFLSSCT